MMLMRLALEPLRTGMALQFYISSSAWETVQLKRTVDALASGGEARVRDYKITAAANGMVERAIYTKVIALWSTASLWGTLPSRDWTVEKRCLAFRLLGRIGCSTEELLGEMHRASPFSVFRCIHHKEQWSVLRRLPSCLLDKWSADLIQPYLDEETLPDELWQRLVFMRRHATPISVPSKRCTRAFDACSFPDLSKRISWLHMI